MVKFFDRGIKVKDKTISGMKIGRYKSEKSNLIFHLSLMIILGFPSSCASPDTDAF